MPTLNFLTIIAAVANLLLGLLVFQKNWKKPLNISFFIFSVASFIWALTNYLFFSTVDTLLMFKLVYSTGPVVIFFLIPWILYLVERNPGLRKVLPFYFMGVILCILPLIDGFVIKSLNISTDASLTFETGPFFSVFGLAVIGTILYANYLIFSNYKRSKGLLRQQLLYIFTGIFLYSSVVIIVGLVLPGLGIAVAVPFDAQSSIFLVGFSTYAIVKHKLMDIRMVVARSVAYTFLIATLAGFYAGVIILAQNFIFPGANYSNGYIALQIVLAIIMAFSFQPLRHWITKVTDKVFFKSLYNKDELLSELSHTLGSTIVLIEMLYKVSDILTREMKVSRTLFALSKDENRLYTIQANGYKATPSVEPRDIVHITKDGIMIADELPDNSAHKRLLRSYDAAIAIPLKTEKEVVGVLFLGEKASGDMYSQQDLAVLEIIAPEISVAIENAKSYEEINRFNVTLRQEVKHATTRLKMKNQQLMELDKAKDEFISMASHQLRTPLTAIKGYLSMLLEGDAGDIKVSQYDFINEAYSGANRMVGLINDLLNVSRMETGRFFLEPKELDIERVVEEEVKQLTNAAKTKGLKLVIEKKGRVPHIWADETKIRQVVMNFMDNAIYYTNTGTVTVVLRHDKDDFIYEVHDTGIGVPRTQIEHLFEKFFRADNARTARPDGTGLGIYLAKRVVEDHGGEIIFDSVEGKGSMFGFRFPLKKRSSSVATSAPAPRPTVIPPVMPMATEIAENNKTE